MAYSFSPPHARPELLDAEPPSATNRPLAAAFTTVPLAAAVDQVRPLIVPRLLRRGVQVTGDLVTAVGVVLCLPFAIMAISMPIVLCLRFLLWMTGML
jgi:hypothetical protein